MEYIEVAFKIKPFSEDIADWIVAEVEDCGFESFVTEPPLLKAYIQENQFDAGSLQEAFAPFTEVTGVDVSYSVSKVENRNWNSEWESAFTPIVSGDRLCICAPFHKDLPPTKYRIVIEPKMAFGTGHHQTTLMMTGFLLDRENLKGLKVADLGCGTGILAILAAMLGAESPVRAIDIDDIAVASAVENAAKNGVFLNVSCGDASALDDDAYDVLLANITRNILLDGMPKFASSVRKGGSLFLSGFYGKDMDVLAERAAECGFRHVSSRNEGDWAAMEFVRL